MASTRLLLFILLAAAVAVTLAASTPKDVIVGSRVPGDYLIGREFVQKDSKWLQVVKVTRTFSAAGNAKITQVRLLDQNKNGKGATATIQAGGPGSSYVTVQFKSERGHSINFITELYGR